MSANDRAQVTPWHLDVLHRLFGPGKTTPRDHRHWMRGTGPDRARMRARGMKVIQR